MTRVRRSAGFAAIGLAIALVVGVASAYWTASSAPAGRGSAAAATIDQAAAPTATGTGSAATVTWSATTLSNGDPVAGYTVARYDASTLARETILTACTGAITTTSCTENNLPTGRWVYSVTPTLGTHWIGAESPMSNAVTTDSTLPVDTITVSALTGNAVNDGDTAFYRGVAAGSFTLTNSVSDSNSGPASSATAALAGDSTGWTHSPSTVSTPSGGPYVSNPFSWTAATATAPTEVVTGRDRAGNAATTSLTFIDDSVAPAGGAITYTDGYQPSQAVVVTFTGGTDAQSGIATRQLQRSSATLAAGSCGTFGSFANVGPADPTSPYTDGQVDNGACYQYRYVVTDQVSNREVVTSAKVAKVNAGPSLGAASSFSVLAGTSVVNTGASDVSGDLGVSPSNSISGFPPGTVAGTIHAGDAAAAQALADLMTAYTEVAARTPGGEFSGDLNGRTFHDGIYHTAAAMALTGTLTLDAQNDPNAIFIFQVDAAANTAASSIVNLINGAQASHVFWQVNGAVGTGASSAFAGTILARGGITLGDNTVLIGQALSYATVTMATNTIR